MPILHQEKKHPVLARLSAVSGQQLMLDALREHRDVTVLMTVCANVCVADARLTPLQSGSFDEFGLVSARGSLHCQQCERGRTAMTSSTLVRASSINIIGGDHGWRR
jgi:hypothetical protein